MCLRGVPSEIAGIRKAQRQRCPPHDSRDVFGMTTHDARQVGGPGGGFD
jgi:hypothetical protein